jgi:hypothetical protein
LQVERQRLQAHLDRSVYVHRVQFEKEFAALSEIWKTIAELRAVFERLTQRRREAEHDGECGDRVRTVVQPKFFTFLNAVDQQSPFYPEDIYRACSEAIRSMRCSTRLRGMEASLARASGTQP